MSESNGFLAVSNGNITYYTYYHPCDDVEYNTEYLNGIGFSWRTAFEIAVWACCAAEGAEYEQDELPGTRIYIV